MEESGIPSGTAAMEMNLLSPDDLSSAVRERIVDVVTPLLTSREGEFNFILSESMNPIHIEYDPDALFKEGGLPPQKFIGTVDGEKIKPLRGLEESLKVGKALLRGTAPAEATPASLNLGLGQPIAPAVQKAPEAAAAPSDNLVQFPEPKSFAPVPDEEPPIPEQRVPDKAGQFKVAGGLLEIETPEAQFRNVVL